MSNQSKERKTPHTPEASLRDAYRRSQGGDLASYVGMIGDSFSHRVDLLAQLIRDNHHPSLGRYKERLLQDTIARFLPSRFKIGTGFVIFPKRHALSQAHPTNPDYTNRYDHEVSSQLDLIVYDASEYPTILQDGDFVVLRPEAVRSIIEVKGAMKRKDVRAAIRSFLDYAKKWTRCAEFYRYFGVGAENVPRLKFPWFMLMGFSTYVDDAGRPATDGARLRKTIVETYRESGEDLTKIPLLNAAYLYNDCIVQATATDENGALAYGYSTNRGQLYSRDREQKPGPARDGTVGDLLAKVHLSLGPPFNFLLSYVEHGPHAHTPLHPHAGFSSLVVGKKAVSMSRKWWE